MNYATDFKSIRNEVSAQEWQTRLDLAACYRLVDAYDMTDLIYNHITARIPGTEHLLINLYGLLYKEITASSLVKIDVEGNIVDKPDTDYSLNVSGYVIHGAIHKARPDVACVLHTHTRAGMAVAAMQCGLLPLSQTSIRFDDHIGYHDYEGPAIDTDERKRIVRRSRAARRARHAQSRAAHLRRDHPAGVQHHVSARNVVPLAGRRHGGAHRTDHAGRERAGAHRASLSARHAAALWRVGMAGDAAAAGGGGEDLGLSAVLALGRHESPRSPAYRPRGRQDFFTDH